MPSYNRTAILKLMVSGIELRAEHEETENNQKNAKLGETSRVTVSFFSIKIALLVVFVPCQFS